MFADPLTQRLADFVISLGIKVVAAPLPHDTFLPGLDIQYGALVVDEAQLKHPGDILHEAGHIAVAEPDRRSQTPFKPTRGEEMAAMAWSFAALSELELAADVVFHGQGYQGGGENLAAAFALGDGPGVPLLGWMGLTVDRHSPDAAANLDTPTFPAMTRWVR